MKTPIGHILIALCLLVTVNAFTQTKTTGFFGKRVLVELTGSGWYPAFTKTNFGYYKVDKHDKLKKTHKTLDLGLKGQLSYAFTNRFMMGIEFALYRMYIPGPKKAGAILSYDENGNPNLAIFSVHHERLTCFARDINLKFEVGSRGNLFPTGISHQFGMGISQMRIYDRDYQAEFQNTPPYNEASIARTRDYIRELSTQKLNGINVFYEIHMRTPITKWLLLSYGYRLNGTLLFVDQAINSHTNGTYSPYNMMKERRFRNFCSINIGLSAIL